MMTHNSPNVQRLHSQIRAATELADLDELPLWRTYDLLAFAAAELPLLIAEMEDPTPNGIKARRDVAIHLAAEMMRRVVEGEGPQR